MACHRAHHHHRADSALPDLCQQVPRLLELLSPGALGVLMATSSQLRNTLRPYVAGIQLSVRDPDVTVDFSVIVNAGWSELKKLSVNNSSIRSEAMQQIIKADWPRLISLNLSSSYMSDAAMACLAQFHWPLLQHLYLNFTNLGTAGLAALVKGSLPQLRELMLVQNRIGCKALAHLAHANWPELRMMSLTDNDLIKYTYQDGQLMDDGGQTAMTEVVKCHWPKLEHLHVNSTTIGAAALAVLAEGRWPNLQSIALGDNDMKDLTSLVRAGWPKLKDLHFGLAMMTDQSIRELVKANWHAMETLDLSSIHRFEAGLTILGDADWPCLKTLWIEDNNTNNSDLTQMLTKARWPLLERLNISGHALNSEALGVLITCRWSSLRFLKFTCKPIDEVAFTTLCQSTWPWLIHTCRDEQHWKKEVDITVSKSCLATCN